MPTHIKVSGSWQEVVAIHVKDGGVWNEANVVSVKDAAAWQEAHASGPRVSPSGNGVTNSVFSDQTCYANMEYRSTGVEYENTLATSSAATVSRGNWLDGGASNEVWVQRVITSGTLSTDAGSGRLQLSSTRKFGITQSGQGTKTCTLTYNFYDAASGGSLIGSSGSLILIAIVDFM